MSKDTIRRTYKYRLYHNNRRDRALRRQIDIAGCIWNHALALQKRYYRLCGKHLSLNRLKAHIARLRNGQRFGWWKALGSQAVQDVLERLDRAWQRFFNKQSRPPKFRQVKKFRSFTLKQAGYKFLGGNKVRIGRYTYKFVKHRDWTGTIKTVTIKRDAAHRLWLCLSVQEKDNFPKASSAGNIGGCDFGLRVFLTDHTGQQWNSPQFLLQAMRSIKALSKSVSRKVKNSHNYKRARWQLNRTHIRIADKRGDFHFKLAHTLFDTYDTLVLEDLNIAAMKRVWGRKVSDLSFSQFVNILEWVARKRGKRVTFIARWERTTGKCSSCGHIQNMPLKARVFRCESCGLELDRDHNAAINIQRAGASACTD